MQNGKLKLSVMFRTALLWAISQKAVVISYRCFGTTSQFHLQGSSIQKKACCPNTEFIYRTVLFIKMPRDKLPTFISYPLLPHTASAAYCTEIYITPLLKMLKMWRMLACCWTSSLLLHEVKMQVFHAMVSLCDIIKHTSYLSTNNSNPIYIITRLYIHNTHIPVI